MSVEDWAPSFFDEFDNAVNVRNISLIVVVPHRGRNGVALAFNKLIQLLPVFVVVERQPSFGTVGTVVSQLLARAFQLLLHTLLGSNSILRAKRELPVTAALLQ